MNILRNILAVIIGAFIGAMLNGWLIEWSGTLIPLPEGVDPNDINSINDNIASYGIEHFIMPFLAHALGTLVGAIIAALIAFSHKLYFALGIGGLFLIGGTMMVFMLPNSPMWFNVIDLVFAYIPMGWLGYKVAMMFTITNN
jgi:hypothetical protein